MPQPTIAHHILFAPHTQAQVHKTSQRGAHKLVSEWISHFALSESWFSGCVAFSVLGLN